MMKGAGGSHQPPPMPMMPAAPIPAGVVFDATAFKQKLKMGKTRAKVQQGKAQNAAFKTRQSVIVELRANKNPTACIRMEQYLRDTATTESYDVLEAYVELLVSRVHLIQSTPVFDNLSDDVKEAVASLVFAASRLSNAELRAATDQLRALYSPAVIDPLCGCTGPNAHCINSDLARKMQGSAPDDYEILDGLTAIAAEEGIPWHAPAEPDELRKPAGSSHHASGPPAYPNFSAQHVPGMSAPSMPHPPPMGGPPPGYGPQDPYGGAGGLPPPPPEFGGHFPPPAPP
jgi:Regulator of Vps4 activity in the MVB pathway